MSTRRRDTGHSGWPAAGTRVPAGARYVPGTILSMSHPQPSPRPRDLLPPGPDGQVLPQQQTAPQAADTPDHTAVSGSCSLVPAPWPGALRGLGSSKESATGRSRVTAQEPLKVRSESNTDRFRCGRRGVLWKVTSQGDLTVNPWLGRSTPGTKLPRGRLALPSARALHCFWASQFTRPWGA